MILNYLKCQRPWLFISAADSDGSDRTRRTRALHARKQPLVLSSPFFDASRKELFRKDEWGLIFKTAAANRAYKRQKETSEGLYSVWTGESFCPFDKHGEFYFEDKIRLLR